MEPWIAFLEANFHSHKHHGNNYIRSLDECGWMQTAEMVAVIKCWKNVLESAAHQLWLCFGTGRPRRSGLIGDVVLESGLCEDVATVSLLLITAWPATSHQFYFLGTEYRAAGLAKSADTDNLKILLPSICCTCRFLFWSPCVSRKEKIKKI